MIVRLANGDATILETIHESLDRRPLLVSGTVAMSASNRASSSSKALSAAFCGSVYATTAGAPGRFGRGSASAGEKEEQPPPKAGGKGMSQGHKIFDEPGAVRGDRG